MNFNPFSHLVETRKRFSARLLRSKFWQRMKDTFRVFYGDTYGAQLGLLDYVNPFARIFEYIFFTSESVKGSRLAKAIFNVSFIPTLILNAIKFLAASVFTAILLPFVAFAHWVLKSQQEKLVNDANTTRIFSLKKEKIDESRDENIDLQKSDLNSDECIVLSSYSPYKQTILDRYEEIKSNPAYSAAYVYVAGREGAKDEIYYVRKIVRAPKGVESWEWGKPLNLKEAQVNQFYNEFHNQFHGERQNEHGRVSVLSSVELKKIRLITGHFHHKNKTFHDLKNTPIESGFLDSTFNIKSLMIKPMYYLSKNKSTFHYVRSSSEVKGSSSNQQRKMVLGLVERCRSEDDPQPDYDDAADRDEKRYPDEHTGRILGVIKIKPENYIGISALLKTNTFWATESLDKAGVLEEVEAQINENPCRREQL